MTISRLVLLVLLIARPVHAQGHHPPPPTAPPRTVALPNLLADLRIARAAYPALLTQAQAGALINAVAWKHRAEGFGLLRKDGGNNCPVTGLAVKVSCDWIVHQPSGLGCDALGAGPDPDAPGPSTPQWCSGDPFDVSKFTAPVQPVDGPVDPPLPPPGVDLTPRVVALEQALAALTSRVTAHDDAIGQVNERIDKLPNAVSEDRLTALIADAFTRAVVTGKTRVAFGHQHVLDLGVTLRPAK